MATFTPRQHNWRIYADDAAEPSTALANENTKPTISRFQPLRIRVCIYETGGKIGNNQDINVQWSTNESTWTNIGAQGTTGQPFRWRNGQATEHGTTTTYKVSCGTAHRLYHEASCTNSESIAASSHSEIDLSIEPYNPNSNTTYYFRVLLEGAELQLYTAATHPQVLTATEKSLASKTSDARVKLTQQFTKLSNARALKLQESVKYSDARILKLNESTKYSDGRIKKEQEFTKTSDAQIASGGPITQEIIKYSDSRIFRTMELSTNSTARVKVTRKLMYYGP